MQRYIFREKVNHLSFNVFFLSSFCIGSPLSLPVNHVSHVVHFPARLEFPVEVRKDDDKATYREGRSHATGIENVTHA